MIVVDYNVRELAVFNDWLIYIYGILKIIILKYKLL